MTSWEALTEAFHLLRPWVLVALVPVVWLWWRQRRAETALAKPVMDLPPHLATALLINAKAHRKLRPVDLVAAVLTLLILAASGPTWGRVADPFAARTAPLVVVVQITPSMLEQDVAPSRLDRAKQKVTDLLGLRSGGRTALAAYAGTAHAVVPMTEDPGVMQPYLEGLQPDIMPRSGRDIVAAFDLALQMLTRDESQSDIHGGLQGGVLFLLDDLPTSDAALLDERLKAMAPDTRPVVSFLFLRPDGQRLPSVPAGSVALSVTPDQADITRLERQLALAQARAQLQDSDQPWHDRGYLLVWPAVVLLLLWFRRGILVVRTRISNASSTNRSTSSSSAVSHHWATACRAHSTTVTVCSSGSIDSSADCIARRC